MQWRHPLNIMITGAVVGLAMATVIMLLSGAHDAGTAIGSEVSPAGSATPVRPLPTARPPDGQRDLRAGLGPVIKGNFPDPEMIKVGNTYYAYATNAGGRNLPIATASAPEGPWTVLDVDGLPQLGGWASTGKTWAPDVSIRPDGTFLLYYTALSRKAKMQCIGAAVASAPTGPFTPVGAEPMICPTTYGDAIDAASFVDVDGSRYVLFRSGLAPKKRRPTAIYLQRVSADGLTVQGSAVQILVQGRDDPILVEAPALVRQGGNYVLLYSTSVFYSAGYRTNYATASAITGPYRRASGSLLSTHVLGKKVVGPGGADILPDPAGDRIVFHGIVETLPGDIVVRGMYVADIGWDSARPVVRGVPARYEAEAGRLTGSQVRSDVSQASGRKAAGYIDRKGSRAEIRVLAPATGRYTLRIKHANRSQGEVHQELAVNGVSPMAVVYPGTEVGLWRYETIGVSLSRGWNTLAFGHLSGIADLDYVELS